VAGLFLCLRGATAGGSLLRQAYPMQVFVPRSRTVAQEANCAYMQWARFQPQLQHWSGVRRSRSHTCYSEGNGWNSAAGALTDTHLDRQVGPAPRNHPAYCCRL
jgi:hypothetical protein